MKRSQSVKPDIKAKIKTEAGKRILAIAPEWKQSNVTARAIELRNIKDVRMLTSEEQSELDAAQTLWDQIRALRAYSDQLEAEVDAGKLVDLKSDWPA